MFDGSIQLMSRKERSWGDSRCGAELCQSTLISRRRIDANKLSFISSRQQETLFVPPNHPARRTIRMRGSVSHVELHFVHFEGLRSLSGPKRKPHLRHSAGVITASNSVCRRLFNTCSKSSLVVFPFCSARREISVTVLSRSSNNVIRSLRNIGTGQVLPGALLLRISGVGFRTLAPCSAWQAPP